MAIDDKLEANGEGSGEKQEESSGAPEGGVAKNAYFRDVSKRVRDMFNEEFRREGVVFAMVMIEQGAGEEQVPYVTANVSAPEVGILLAGGVQRVLIPLADEDRQLKEMKGLLKELGLPINLAVLADRPS